MTIKITPLRSTGLRVYLFEADEGDTWSVVVPPGTRKEDRANLSVYLAGRARVSREKLQLVDYREPGMTTLDLEWVTDDPGTVTYLAETDFKYLCISHPQNYPLHEESVKLSVCGQLLVPKGRRAFIVEGEATVNDMMTLGPMSIATLRNNDGLFTAGVTGAWVITVKDYP